jgi:hypothetical protein
MAWRKKLKDLGLPALAPVKARGKQPRSKGRFTKPEPDARETGLQARVKHFGATDTPDARRALSGQHIGSQLGMVMQRECQPDECARLWTVWQAFCMAEATYRMRIIGQSGNPKGATIAMLPDKLEADTGHTVDLRDSDQRDRDAVNAWMRWRGFIGHLDARYRVAIHDAERGIGPDLWRDCNPTSAGLVALEALRRLAKVVG